MRAIFASIAAVVGTLLVVSCTPVQHAAPRPFAGKRPADTTVDLAGSFTFSPAGELGLALERPCRMVFKSSTGAVINDACDAAHLHDVYVLASTPWKQEVRARWADASHLVFRFDWKATGLDPLADDAIATLARAWPISGTSWTPSAAEAAQILTLIGDATDTQPALVHGGPPPKLEVTAFEVSEGALRAGGQSQLLVKIANHGDGAAYRVAVSTRSSVDSLHGQRLAFGLIKPGAEKTRQIALAVPPGETSPDTMLVLVVAEGNGAAPANVSHRVPIVAVGAAVPTAVTPAAPVAAGPVLAVRCAITGHEGERPEVSAGDSVPLHCVVDNTGGAAAKVELEVAIGTRAPVRGKPQAVAAAGHAAFDVPLAIPRELPIDSTLEVGITARDRKAKLSVHTTVAGVVRKRKLCMPGQLTRAQYKAKLTELRSAVAAGDMTQAQLDRFDAELVTCLK